MLINDPDELLECTVGHKTSERGGIGREGGGKRRSRGKERGMRKGKKEEE